MKKFKTINYVCLLHVSILNCTDNRIPFSLLRKLLPENAIVLEAGAHIGQDTVWMSEFWKKGKIYTFEPNPESYKKLCDTIRQCNNVFTFPVALSKEPGAFPFYLIDGASSLLKPTAWCNNAYFHADLSKPIQIQVTTIDQWAKENNISKIDFMWLDMEGNEINALEGALSILKKVHVIYSEANFRQFWENCAQYQNLVNWLQKQGFEKIWEDIVPNWQANILFVNKEY